MGHLETKRIITTNNLTNGTVRRLLYEAFDYDRILAREARMKAENIADGLEAHIPLGDHDLIEDHTFAENRIRYFNQDFWDDLFPQLRGTPPTNVQKLAYLAKKLRNYWNGNELPRALLDVVAPKFFEMYPNGEIWFVQLDELTLRKIWKDEDMLQGYGTFGSPHVMSGLEGGLSSYIWLHLMTHFFYPFINGFIVTQDARRIFLFFPDQAMSTIGEYQFDLYTQTQFDLVNVYSDSLGSHVSRGIKSRFPQDFTVLPEMRSYFEWYIDRCDALLGQLLAIGEVKQRFILVLTLNRIAVETELIETSELPYLMKLLFYGVLDKYAKQKCGRPYWPKDFTKLRSKRPCKVFPAALAKCSGTVQRGSLSISNSTARRLRRYVSIATRITATASTMWTSSWKTLGICTTM
jgi:hypothetical protein